MKTAADVKRRLSVKGVKVKMIRHDWYPTGKLIDVVREVEKIQSNAVMFQGGSWLYFNSAKETIVESANSFSKLLSPTGARITYEFVD